MAFGWFPALFRASGKSGGSGSRPVPLNTEIAGLEAVLAGLEAEFRVLERAAALGRPDLIPATLRTGRPPAEPPHPGDDGAETAALESRRDRQRELLALARAEHRLFAEALTVLRPAMPWEAAGAGLRPLCQKAFDLSGFYLARADWEAGEIRFPYFFDAGRPIAAEPLPLDPASGLTGWALFAGGPRYLESKQACLDRGMRLTEAELGSGLHTKSWFGVPLPGTDPTRPMGLLAFHCYHARAFSASRLERMTTLALLAAMHLQQP